MAAIDLVRPPRLQAGATIGIALPSGPAEPLRLQAGCAYLESLGYRVRLGANAGRSTGFTAGTLNERLEAFEALHFDPSIGAIVMARGGAGAIVLLDRLRWDEIVRTPKLWMGFSDFTVLSAAALCAGMVTIHGPMAAVDFCERDQPDTLASWQPVLFGRDYPRRWPLEAGQVLRHGSGRGRAVAGCLSLFGALAGTPFAPPLDGAVLFIEDVDEPPYRVARLLTAWDLAGKLQNLQGIVIGSLARCAGAGGESQEQLHELMVAGFGRAGIDVPIVAGAPFGHLGPNRALAVGCPVSIDTTRLEIVFEEPGVE